MPRDTCQMGWIREVVREWLVRLAWQGGGPVGRWPALAAAGLVCWRLGWLERGCRHGWPRWLLLSDEDSVFFMLLGVIQVMAEARDAGASRVARRTLEKLSTTTPDLAAEALTVYQANYLKVTPALVAYLLAPLPETAACPHTPRVRLVGYLSAAETPDTEWEARLRVELAYELVQAVYGAEDDGVSDPLTELLSTTDQPLLLRALENALQHRVSDRSLWLNARPLTRILQANPHLPLPVDGGKLERFHTYRGVLLAVLKGHDNPVPADVRDTSAYEAVHALLKGLRQPAAPSEFTERCRRALRTLDSVPAREALCSIAADGNAEAEAAAVEAGFASKHDIIAERRRIARSRQTSTLPWKAGGYHTNPGGIHT